MPWLICSLLLWHTFFYSLNIVSLLLTEYEALDATLDEIDTWMNKLEEQNDSLNAQLDDLLQSSKQVTFLIRLYC